MLSDEMESRKSGDFKFQTGAKNFPTILETQNPNGEEEGLVEFEVEYLLLSLSFSISRRRGRKLHGSTSPPFHSLPSFPASFTPGQT